VKRIQVEKHLEPPARLRSYDPADWPGEDPLREWKQARKEYAGRNGWCAGDPLDELIDRRQILGRMARP
jgi:hypothetical protein